MNEVRTGVGGHFGDLFYTRTLAAKEVEGLTIMDAEGVALVAMLELICRLRPSAITGTRFIFLCDNDPFVETVKNGRSPLPQLAYLLDILHDLQCQYSFDLQPIYIKSKANEIADALSRGDMFEF